jgi:L,D-peptidoglycan transpeptidase YkuD (ErfK/YbiS/YcfS/YnhG family)
MPHTTIANKCFFLYNVDDIKSPDYNQWVRYSGDPHKRWKSFERLAIAPYAYAAVIEYTESPIIAGKGSAIFFTSGAAPILTRLVA